MALISAADLARVVGYTETLGMPDTFSLERTTLTSDGAGGETAVTSTPGSGNCRLREVNQQSAENLIAGRLSWLEVYVIDMPLSAQPTVGDIVIINSRRFEIGGILRAGLYQTFQACVVRERG